MKRARRIANIPALDSLASILLADDIARAILADREAQAKRVDELEMAVRELLSLIAVLTAPGYDNQTIRDARALLAKEGSDA